jgi:hypothetical protein
MGLEKRHFELEIGLELAGDDRGRGGSMTEQEVAEQQAQLDKRWSSMPNPPTDGCMLWDEPAGPFWLSVAGRWVQIHEPAPVDDFHAAREMAIKIRAERGLPALETPCPCWKCEQP